MKSENPEVKEDFKKSRVHKKEATLLYKTVADKIIREYFRDEQNKLLIKYIRLVAEETATISSIHIAKNKSVNEIAEGVEIHYSSKNMGMELMKKFLADNPTFEISQQEFIQKLTKFSILFDYELLKAGEIPDKEKLKTFKSRLIGYKRYEFSEQEPLISDVMRRIIDNTENEIKILEQHVLNAGSDKSNIRIVWQKDNSVLNALLKALSFRSFSPNISALKKNFNGENVSFQIEPQRFEQFVWLLHILHENNCYKTTPKKGHLVVFENVFDWDYCNSPSKVPFKKIVNKIKKNTPASNPVKTIVSAILTEAKIAVLKKDL